jgi:hypothetical protein
VKRHTIKKHEQNKEEHFLLKALTLSLATRQKKTFQSCKESLHSGLKLQHFEKNMCIYIFIDSRKA